MRELRDGLAVLLTCLLVFLTSLWFADFLLSVDSDAAHVAAGIVAILGMGVPGLFGLPALLLIAGGLGRLVWQGGKSCQMLVARLCLHTR